MREQGEFGQSAANMYGNVTMKPIFGTIHM